MSFLKTNKNFYLSILVILQSFIPIIAMTPDQLNPQRIVNPAELEERQQELEELRTILKKGFEAFYRMSLDIEHFASIIKKGRVRMKNTEEIMRILMEIRSFIVTLIPQQATYYAIEDPAMVRQVCVTLYTLAKELIDHLDTMVDSNFKQLKPFDFAGFQKRKLNFNLSIKTIKQRINSIERLSNDLHEKADLTNLTWYNISARKFEKYVVKPWNDYNMSTYSYTIGLTGLYGALVVWEAGSSYYSNQLLVEKQKWMEKKIESDPNKYTQYFAMGKLAMPHGGLPQEFKALKEEWEVIFKDYMKNKVNPLLRPFFNTLGWPLPMKEHGGIDEEIMVLNGERYGFLSHIMSVLNGAMSGHRLPLLSVGFGWVFAQYKDVWEKTGSVEPGGLQARFLMARQKLWNYLRGGAYLQQRVNPLQIFSNVTFDDVIGLEEVKDELRFLLAFIENPEMFIRAGKIPERGYLLTGPTRTGKSFVIEALFGEIQKRMFAKGSESFKCFKITPAMINAMGIEEILARAKMLAPIILWIDEIDLLGLQRGVGDNKALMQFLTGMGNSFDNDPNKLVIIIAATNRPDNLDHALKQPGRFGKEIRFQYPSADYRRKYIIRELESMAIDRNHIDIETFVQKTEGRSFEDLRAFIRNASIKAYMTNRVLDEKLLDEMIDIEIRHMIPVSHKNLSETERDILAIHFAGKAIAQMLLDTQARLDKVTIKPVMTKLDETFAFESIADKDKQEKRDKHRIEYGQIFTKHLDDTIHINTYEQTINEIKILLAGFAAEEILKGASSYSCHPDDGSKAYKQAEDLILEGVEKERIPRKKLDELGYAAYELKKRCYSEIKALLLKYRPALELLAEALKEEPTLTAAQVEEIIAAAMEEANASHSRVAQETESRKEVVIDNTTIAA